MLELGRAQGKAGTGWFFKKKYPPYFFLTNFNQWTTGKKIKPAMYVATRINLTGYGWEVEIA